MPNEHEDLNALLNWSRGTEELAKVARIGRILFEVAGAGLIVAVARSESDAAVVAYSPLVFLFVPAIVIGLEAQFERLVAFSRWTRRLALRGFATGSIVDGEELVRLREERPRLWSWALRWSGLRRETVQRYYCEPRHPPGPHRLKELYACSAYYSVRILKQHAGWMALFALLVLAVGLATMFLLTLDSHAPESGGGVPRDLVIDIVYSVMFGTVAARLGYASWAAAQKQRALDQVFRALYAGRPSTAALEELVDRYDMERSQGPLPPTLLYRQLRRQLAEDWRKLQDEVAAPL